jgi:hypothetical protein
LGDGRIRELERWYEQALADPIALSRGDRAKALAGLGSALVFLERPEQARAALIEALALYRVGIADAANIDPLTAAAEIVNP